MRPVSGAASSYGYLNEPGHAVDRSRAGAPLTSPLSKMLDGENRAQIQMRRDEAVPSIKVPRPQNHKDIPVIDWVVQQVVRVVRTWARFPTNTRLVAAYFVCHIVRTFHNPDVLLLPHMWRMHQNIKTELFQV